MQKKGLNVASLLSSNSKVASLWTMQPKDSEEARQFREYKKEKILNFWFIFVFVRFVLLCSNLLLYFCFDMM